MPPVKKPKVKIANDTKQEELTPVISGQLKKKLQRQRERQKLRRGVVLIRHLPHGFFEDQLRGYFQQFGNVTRLRLARSKLTGGPKGYAYIEFEYPEVAEVAAETMDNYLMFNKLVKATYIPPERQFHNFFKSSVRQVKNKAGKTIYISAKTTAIAKYVKKFNEISDEVHQRRTARKLKAIQKLNEKYAHLGIDFNRIVLRSKKIDKDSKTETSIEKADETSKTAKRKNNSTEKSANKLKKTSGSKDLLNRDTDDEDEDEEEDTKGNQDETVNLEDLLGDTLNEDSDDEDWSDKGDNSESDGDENDQSSESEHHIMKNESSDEEDEDDDDDYNDEKHVIQTLKAKKKASKAKKGETNNLDQLIKRKKNTGGIQKPRKVAHKPKILQAKNAMQIPLAKTIAQPLPKIKKNTKTAKQNNKTTKQKIKKS